MAALTLYFDGRCAFCTAEMTRLAGWNAAGKLAFVDIAAADFDPAPLGVVLAALNRELHGRTDDGRLLVGIDCMLAAYTLAGRARRVAPLRVRALRPLLAACYRWFARNRYRISALLGYQARPACADGVCAIGNPFMKGRTP